MWMSDQRVELQPAVIIHQRAFKNTSAIIEFFTRDHGRVALLAQGVKRSKSKWRSVLQPFQLLQISWAGRGELPRLTLAESCGQLHYLSGDQLFSALYVNELMLRLFQRQDAYPEIFDHYLKTLERLNNPDEVNEALRRFEKHLLQALGYALQLGHDALNDKALDASLRYRFIPGQGFTEEKDVRLSKQTVTGDALLALDRDEYSEEVLRVAKLIMRQAIDDLLGGKPLRTRELFRAYKQKTTQS